MLGQVLNCLQSSSGISLLLFFLSFLTGVHKIPQRQFPRCQPGLERTAEEFGSLEEGKLEPKLIQNTTTLWSVLAIVPVQVCEALSKLDVKKNIWTNLFYLNHVAQPETLHACVHWCIFLQLFFANSKMMYL